ncbi:hypothetical protein ACE6H2_019622 [Prunus campanulata]
MNSHRIPSLPVHRLLPTWQPASPPPPSAPPKSLSSSISGFNGDQRGCHQIGESPTGPTWQPRHQFSL